MTNNNMNLMIRDPYRLPELAEYIKTIKKDGDLIDYYLSTKEVSIISWAIRCMLMYEMYRRGISFSIIAVCCHTTRQTAWRESEIWEKIISKAPELLNEPFLSKTFYKRVVEAKVEDPIKELWRIADEREKISLENIERGKKGAKLMPQLSTRRYVREKQGGKVYNCDMCGESVKKFYKICENCFNKFREE